MIKNLLLAALLCLPVFGEDLILSYRGAYKEHRVFNETFHVARAMIPHASTTAIAVFELPLEPEDDGKTLTRLLRERQDAVIEELFKNGILLTDASNTTAANTQTKTVITLPALAVRATIKGTFVSIALLE